MREAMECGTKGVSVGRNVWTHKKPTVLTRTIYRIVHDNASIEILKEIK